MDISGILSIDRMLDQKYRELARDLTNEEMNDLIHQVCLKYYTPAFKSLEQVDSWYHISWEANQSSYKQWKSWQN